MGLVEAEARVAGEEGVRSLALERWEPVGDRRGGLEVAGPREDAMKPSLVDQAASAEGPWEECFELAVQLALRAGQVSAAALLPRPGRVRVSAAPRAGAGAGRHAARITPTRHSGKSDQK